MKRTEKNTGKKLPVCDLKREYRALSRDIERSVKRVLNSGWYVLGAELESFEREFARYTGSAHAVGVASGTEAIQLALMALSVGGGDEVITAVNTAIPTAMAIAATGAKPVFVDVDIESSNMNPSLMERAITEKTRAVVPVHLYGRPCDMVGIVRTARKHGVTVVEDCAQSLGSEYGGAHVGTIGLFGAFSFYPTKNLGCYGDGGAIVTDSAVMAKKLRMLRNYGQSTRYLCDIHGINSRLDEIQAAILRAKLKKIGSSIRRRIEIASIYDGLLKNVSGVTVHDRLAGVRDSYHLYVIECDRRNDLKDYLSANGIETQIHYPVPLHLQKAFRSLGYRKGDFPVAERLASRILSLPMFPSINDKEVSRVCRLIGKFYEGYPGR